MYSEVRLIVAAHLYGTPAKMDQILAVKNMGLSSWKTPRRELLTLKRKVLLAITILMLVFIWIQSVIPESKSAHESLWFTNTVVNPLLHCLGFASISRNMVRKIAHVFEFLVLSIFVALSCKGHIVKSIYAGFTIAFLDETIQILNGRGALITDLWIDLIGIGIGTTIGSLIWNSVYKK